MKRLTSVIIIFTILLTVFVNQSNGIEKNYKWLKLPVYGGVISSICQGTQYSLYCSTRGDGIYALGSDYWEPIVEDNIPDYVYFVFEWNHTLFCGTDNFLLMKNTSGEWNKVSKRLSDKKIRATKMYVSSSRDNDVLFVSSDQGLFKSYDQGLNWVADPTINVPVYTVAVSPSNQNILYVSAGNGRIFFSNDHGVEWNEIQNEKVYGRIISLCVDKYNDKILYAGTPEKGIYISNDGGHTWKSESNGLANLYISFVTQTYDGHVFCGTYEGLHTFNARVSQWEKIGDELFNSNITTGLFVENDDSWVVGTNGGGVHMLNDSTKRWTQHNDQITNLHVRCLDQDQKGETILFGTWGGGVHRSYDNGKSWKPSNNGLTNPYILCIARINENEYILGTYNGGLFKSVDAGISWAYMETPNVFTKYIYSLCSLPSKTSTIYLGTNNGIYKTDNSGKYWKPLPLGSYDNPIGNVLDIEINPRNEDEVFIATDETGLYSSKNAGKEWYFSGKGIENKHITSVAYHPNYSDVLFCTTVGSGVFCSKDNGNSWKPCNEGLGSLVVYCIEFNDADKEEILIGTETGIYRKNSMEDPWELFGNGTEGLRVRSILKNPASDSYFAGTDQKGLFRNIHFPNVPVPMSPKNNERLITLRPTLLWTETTDVTIPYTFSLKITNPPGEIVFQKDHISGDQFIVPAGVLTRYKTYYWTVRAESFAGNTQWSKTYSFILIGQVVLQINEPLMTVNGTIVEVDPGRSTTPIIHENRTFLPIRSIVESFGGTVEWEPSTRAIVLRFQENIIELQLMNPIAKSNGKNVQIDSENKNIVPFIENERTMIPLRFVAENFDIEIQWKADEREIILEYPPQ